MPTISSGDLEIISRPYHRIVDATLDLFPLRSIGTAVVSTLAASYPFADIPITSTGGGWGTLGTGGTHDAFRRGQYAVIRQPYTDTFVLDTAWRKQSTSTTLLQGLGITRGDSGKAVEQAEALTNGQIVTCYDVFVPKVSLSRIVGGTYYKRFDLAFSSFKPTPQSNIGPHRSASVNPDTGIATLEFSLSSSSTSWLGGVLSVTWELPISGAAFAPGYSSTSNPVQVQFSPGVYIMTALVNDTGSNVAERVFRYVFVHGTDGVTEYKSFGEQYGVGVPLNDVENRAGRSMTFEAAGSGVETALYTGAPVLFTYRHEFSSDGITWTAPSEGTLVETFFGHVESFELIGRDEFGVESVQFKVVSPLLYSEKLPYVPQYLIEAETPSQWWEIPPSCCHAGFVPWYVCDFAAPHIQELNDYFPGDGSSYFKYRWDIDADNLADAMRVAARPFLGNLGNTSDGALHLSRNPQYEIDANRNAVPVVMQITADRMFPPIEYQRREIMPVRETEGAAFIYEGEGTHVKISGRLYRKGLNAPMQGTQVAMMPDFIAQNVTEAATKVGHYHQRLNAPTPTIQFEMPGNYDAFRPALMEWWEFNTPWYDPMTSGIYSKRILPTQVTREWAVENGSVIKTLQVEAEPETYGQPAVRRVLPIWNGQGVTPKPAEPGPNPDPDVDPEPTYDWRIETDFTTTNGASEGWAIANQSTLWSPSLSGVYTAGVGYQSVDQTAQSPATDQRTSLVLTRSGTLTNLRRISIFYDYNLQGGNRELENQWIAITTGYSPHYYLTKAQAEAYAGTDRNDYWLFTRVGIITTISITLTTRWWNGGTPPPAGGSIIRKIILYGDN